MNMPYFTAEASLYKSVVHYKLNGNVRFQSDASTFVSSSAGIKGGVLPQFRLACTRCVWNTFDFPVPTCAKLCRVPTPPGQPQPMEFPVECDPSECPPRPPSNCCPQGCVHC